MSHLTVTPTPPSLAETLINVYVQGVEEHVDYSDFSCCLHEHFVPLIGFTYETLASKVTFESQKQAATHQVKSEAGLTFTNLMQISYICKSA